MASNTVNNVIPGQAVANGAIAKLVFTANNSYLNGLSVLPASVYVTVTSIKVTNASGALASLTLAAGDTGTTVDVFCPATPIPLPTVGAPYTELLDAPIVLEPGQSLWALTSVAAALNIRADGMVSIQ